MRKLIYIIILAVLAWGGYWFVGATALESGLGAWFEQRRAEGWQADYTSLKTRGFPNRFDTTIQGLDLADTTSGLAWSAPFFQVFALSYQPGHIVAIWPQQQTIATPEQTLTIAADNMRASVVFNETTDLNLNRTSFVLEGLSLQSTQGWNSQLQSGQLAMRQLAETAPATAAYQVDFHATGLTPASEFIRKFRNIDFLTDTIQGVDIDANISFDAPWDRFSIERARPQITHIDLELLRANWGQLDLRLAGSLQVDASGVPTGQITVKAKNWREMVALAHQAGLIPDAILPSLESSLSFLATLSGDKNTLDTPLTFRNGYVAFGPIPLGPAPNLHLR